MTSTLPTEFDLRPDITPTDEESRSMAFEIPAVRSSPSANLFKKNGTGEGGDDTTGDDEEIEHDDDDLGDHHNENNIDQGSSGCGTSGDGKKLIKPLIKLSTPNSEDDKNAEENPFDPLGSCRPCCNLLHLRTFMLTALLLLLFASCLVVLVIESESDMFGPLRKTPEMVILRRDYYEPMKRNFMRKFIR